MAGTTIKSEDLAKVTEVDFVDQFVKGIDTLKELLGITRMVEKVPGQVIKTYKASGTLESGAVAEGADIPLSSYKTEVKDAFEVTLLKWRKQTTLEAINDKGYEQAVVDTDDAMLADIHGDIKSRWFSFLKQTSGRSTASGTGLKGALAHTWAKLGDLAEDYNVGDADMIFFVNREDIADFLGDKDNYASMATESGITYLEKFLGLYDVAVYSGVTKGKVYGTFKNNVIMYYANPSNSDIAGAFEFTTDETGLIGVHHDSKYANLTTDTVAVCGIALYAEIVTFICIGTIEAEAEADSGSGGE